MTKLEEEALHAFGKTYAAMTINGASEFTLCSYVNDFVKNQPKTFYRIYMRDSGKPWGGEAIPPKYSTYEEAKKVLFNFYSAFTNNPNLRISTNMYDSNYWRNTYEIRKITESN